MAAASATPSPSKIPASIAHASKEDLEKLLVNTLHKLKARDRQITELEQQVEEAKTRDGSVISAEQRTEAMEKRMQEDMMVLQEGFAKERHALETEHTRVVEALAAKERLLQKELEESKKMLDDKDAQMEEMRKNGIVELKERLEQTKKELMEEATNQSEAVVIDAPDPSKYVAIEEHEALRKDMADLKKKFALVLKKQKLEGEKKAGEGEKEGPMYQQLKKEVEVERSRFKKALGELKRRNEGLVKAKDDTDKVNATMEVQIEALRAELVAESRKAQEAQSLAEQSSNAFKEYKQRAHTLLKAKEDELKAGRFAVKEEFEKELQNALSDRDAVTKQLQEVTEELEVLKSEIAGKVHSVEKKYKDQLAEMKKELEIHMEHARNSTRQYDQLRIRYESFEDRYQSLKNELAEAKSTADKKDSAVLGDLQLSLDRSEKEKKSLQEVNAVMHGEITDLKAMVQQLKLTLAMKSTALQASTSDSIEEYAMAGDPYGEVQDSDMQRLQEEIASANRRASAAEREVDDLEKEVALHNAQEKALKETVRELERELERVKLASKSIDMEYFKNILLKLFETGEDESILPVVGTMLQFSPSELKRCQEAIASRQQQDMGILPTDATISATNYISNLFGFAEE